MSEKLTPPGDDAPREPAALVDSAPADSAPTDSAPTDSAPTDSAPTDSAPTDSAPTDSAPVDAAGAAASSPVPSGRRALLPLLLVGLLTSAMVAGVAYLAVQLRDAGRTDTARTEAIAASRDAARLLFSYDYTTLEDDFAKGLSVTTGDFREEYSRTTKDVVTGVATEYKAVVAADVVESAVVSASPDEVTTVVFLNQATTSTQIEGRQVDQSRVRLHLVERDGRWLVDAVQAL